MDVLVPHLFSVHCNTSLPFPFKNSVLRRLLLFSLCGDTMGWSASARKVCDASQPAFQKVRMKIRGAAQPAAKAKAKVKQCSKPRCRNNAASPRAKYCIGCFRDNARCTGARTGGNSSAKGLMGNRGNTSSRQKKKITALVIIHIELAAEARIKKVCRRCWRNLRAQQLMEQQGPAVVAIMSPESQEEEQ